MEPYIIWLAVLTVLVIVLILVINTMDSKVTKLNAKQHNLEIDNNYCRQDVIINRDIIHNLEKNLLKKINECNIRLNMLESEKSSIIKELKDGQSNVGRLHKMQNDLRITLRDAQDEIILLKDTNITLSNKLKKLKKKC